jgi:hypothetical protein
MPEYQHQYADVSFISVLRQKKKKILAEAHPSLYVPLLIVFVFSPFTWCFTLLGFASC